MSCVKLHWHWIKYSLLGKNGVKMTWCLKGKKKTIGKKLDHGKRIEYPFRFLYARNLEHVFSHFFSWKCYAWRPFPDSAVNPPAEADLAWFHLQVFRECGCHIFLEAYYFPAWNEAIH